ncbi:MAG: thioredoxin domain-containing protein [Armatimonadota bacterium]|nr:thioredoxin domain-containing protein [Armatimonadota bacterium]MDR7612748.1 thioredoxin domain-containing protein [Armatimonadota bacterium]
MNRLAAERSAYLQAAAHQPVDWFPWSEEAFQRARREDRPILLDVGAVWCHWCHVMDRESYENPEVARIINENFVAIKVDRDERPDIDARYQQAVGALSGEGGWPLTAFLTPDGQVFFGGTYFPPTDSYGRPAFSRVLLSVARYYRDNRSDVLQAAADLHRQLAAHGRPRQQGDLNPDLLAAAEAAIGRAFDPSHGGFGSAPKFPHPATVEFLLRRHFRTRAPDLLEMAALTLDRMARGGIHDQVGGGFHRYATDARWILPHFEKMLYDNAALLLAYLHGYQATGREAFRAVAADTIDFMAQVLWDPQRAAFRGSQDADVAPGDDGGYFTWSEQDARAVLTDDEFAVLAEHYHLRGRGEVHTDPTRHVLYVDRDPDVVAASLGRDPDEVRRLIRSGRARLAAARARRQAPITDPACYASWNGMAVSAFLEASVVLDDARCRALALQALEGFLQAAFSPARGFAHALGDDPVSGIRFLDDQAQMAQALLDAYETTGQARYLRVARLVADLMLRDYWEGTGFRDVPRDASGPGTDLPHIPVQDAPTPAANAVAARVLLRLSRLFHHLPYREAAEDLLRAWAPALAPHAVFASTLLLAVDDLLTEPAHVTVVGPLDDWRTAGLHAAARRTYRPDKIISVHGDGQDVPLPPVVQAMATAARQPTAYVCAGTACAPPVTDPQVLADTLATFGTARP